MKKEKDTKERILETAFNLFTASTYDKVSMNEIAKKSNVSKGGLFHHFDSKYDLATESLFWYMDKQMGHLFTDEYIKKVGPKEHLKSIIDFTLDTVVENIHLAVFVMDLYKEAETSGKNIRIWIDFLQRYLKFIQSNYAKLKVKNPQLKALLFLSCLDGLSLYFILLNQTKESFNIEKLRKELYRMFIDDV